MSGLKVDAGLGSNVLPEPEFARGPAMQATEPVAQAQQQGGLTPAQQDAVDIINARLETAWNNPVTYRDVQQVSLTLRDLAAVDQNAVVAELARTAMLDRFAREMLEVAPLGLGGLTGNERVQLFEDLARKLDGANLARVATALSAAQSGVGRFQLLEDFGTIVGAHGSAVARVEFVQEMASQTTDERGVSSIFIGGSHHVAADPEAMAVAEVLGSLRGAYAEEAIRSLSPDQLRAVVNASLEARLVTTVTTGVSATSLTYDPNEFSAIMIAGASMQDPAAKRLLFDAAGDALREVERGHWLVSPGRSQTLATLADGMTALLLSDPAGVVRELAINSATWDGSDLATYAKVMLDQGRTEELGAILAGLQFGNGNTANPVARFEAPTSLATGGERYDNAAALGYFVGSIYRGAQALTSDAAAQNTLITEVGKTALTIVDKTKAWGAWAGIGAAVAKEWVGFMLREFNPPPGMRAAQIIESHAIPFDPATGEQAVSSNAYSAYSAALERVRRMANP